MSSRSKVTITLGRRGQVVKNGASGEMQSSGTKRPISERLGANVEDTSFYGGQSKNKRKRMESNGSNLGGGILDQRIEGGDLRLKLIRKGVTKKPHTLNGGEVDLREKLLRKLPTKTALKERERKWQRERERESGKQREQATDLPARRVAATHPSWSYDGRDELHVSQRGGGHSLTPPGPPPLNRPYVDLGRVGTAGTVCSSRPSSSGYGGLSRGTDLVGGSRVASDYANNGVVGGAEMRKPVLPLPPPPQKLPELPATVDELLTSLELEKYAIIFKVEEVDMGALKQMGDTDLKELGIPMGPRKKILLAVRSSVKQRPH